MQPAMETVIGGDDSFMTVRHVTLRGTNFAIGHALGQLAIGQHGDALVAHAADPTFARARRRYFRRDYPVHWERVRGVATAFGADPEDDRFDLTWLPYHLGPSPGMPGCSVAHYPPTATADGHGYLSRNFDFSLGTIAEVMGPHLPPGQPGGPRPVMSEPYIVETHPTDGGYAAIALHAFDLLSGTLDGLNSAGLAVSIMADEEAITALGPHLELHPGAARMVGLNELQVMRLLLDTCATAAEARDALLAVKQFYAYVPCHYLVADRSGESFIYENSTGRNTQYIIPGGGRPQVATNFQVHRHPTRAQMPGGALTLATNAFWRYRTLEDRIAAGAAPVTAETMKANNACVNVLRLREASGGATANPAIANLQARTLWHSLYDLEARTVEISFYLGDEIRADGCQGERRSNYLRFALPPACARRATNE
jgi:hypothetical protein